MPDIFLAVLCRNDQEQLRRCVESCRDLVAHTFVVDTGSDDQAHTQDVLVESGIPFSLSFSEWVNFGANRNHLLTIVGRQRGYALLLDADMTVEVQRPLRELVRGSYALDVLDGSDVPYQLPLLVRTDQPVRYVGETHEYLWGWNDQSFLPEFKVRHHCDGSRRPTKFQEDFEILAAAYAKDQSDPRTTFYLANTCRDLGYRDYALRLYKQRVRLGGWQAEVDASLRQIAILEAGGTAAVQVP